MVRFRTCLTDNIRAQYSTLASSQWLTVRLQIIGAFMVSAVSLTAVVQHNFYFVDTGKFLLIFPDHTC